MHRLLLFLLTGCVLISGCGTTKWSDTKRTATEQLLISDAIDRAVSRISFRAVAGKKVYLDAGPLKGITDAEYLTSSLRQKMLADGCLLAEKASEAEYMVEARAGAIGTNRNELLFGVPATNIPSQLPVPGASAISSIPELPLAKSTEQKGMVKIAVFAYNRATGRPVWQSGTVPTQSTAKDLWVLGAGPFQSGTIHDGTKFAGDKLPIPLIDHLANHDDHADMVSVADEAFFAEQKTPEVDPTQQLAREKPGAEKTADGESGQAEVIPAGHTEEARPGSIAASRRSPEAAPTKPAAPTARGEKPPGRLRFPALRFPKLFPDRR